LCTIGRICSRCTGCVAMATLWKCVAEPSGNPPGPPHAARSATHYACRRRLPSPAIKSTRLLRAPFRFVHTAGVVMRTRNVSEYMLVLAPCLVKICDQRYTHDDRWATGLWLGLEVQLRWHICVEYQKGGQRVTPFLKFKCHTQFTRG